MLQKLFGRHRQPLSDDEFWKAIELYSHGDDKEAKSLLGGRKSEYSHRYDELIANAHSWDLWGAAYVIYGGCSDDSFCDFKHFLISRGRETFENAIADPESLVDLSIEDLEKALQIEGGSDGMREPSGQPWNEDGDELKDRYPRLWKRFGDQPIQ